MVIFGRICRLRLLPFVVILGLTYLLFFTHYKGNWIENVNWIGKWTVENTSPSKLSGFRNQLEITQREQVRRKNKLSKVCKQFDLRSRWESTVLDHFIVDDDHKIIYCYIPKVACTNWKKIFMALEDGKTDTRGYLGNQTHSYEFKTLNSYSTKEIKHKLQHYMKFVFVRDPYERLLSAYRNKFENVYSSYFRKRYGRLIIQKYRKNPDAMSVEKGHDVTFSEFLKYITSLSTKNYSASFNEHWRPMFDLCLPCSINYDVIGKYNTLEEDADYVLWKAGLSDIVSFPRREANYHTERSSDLMSSYYHNVSKQIIFKLKDIYKYDFMLFEYNASLWD